MIVGKARSQKSPKYAKQSAQTDDTGGVGPQLRLSEEVDWSNFQTNQSAEDSTSGTSRPVAARKENVRIKIIVLEQTSHSRQPKHLAGLKVVNPFILYSYSIHRFREESVNMCLPFKSI